MLNINALALVLELVARLFLFRLIKNLDFGRIGMKVVVFLRHKNTKTQNKPLKLKHYGLQNHRQLRCLRHLH